MEFKWKGKKLYLSFILDDHSRYILDWYITSSATFEFVKDLLSKNFKQYGKPKVVKSDNGPQFRKQFREFLESWDIVHHPNPVYTSTYNGKTERKNKDIQAIIEHIDVDEKSLEELFAIIGNAFYEHNHIRPHQSLGGATPYQSYNNFDAEVRARMEAFKKCEKERKGFKTKNEIILPNEEENNQGLIVPAHLVKDPSVLVGFVKSFIDIRV